MDGLLLPLLCGVLLLLGSGRLRYRGLEVLAFITMFAADLFLTYAAFIFGYVTINKGSGTVVLLELGAVVLGYFVPRWLSAYWEKQAELREKRKQEEKRERAARIEQERQRRITACREEMAYLQSVHPLNLLPFLDMVGRQGGNHPEYHKLVGDYGIFRVRLDQRMVAAKHEANELGFDSTV